MLLLSAHFEVSYSTSSGYNMLSNGTYLHANYKTHISMLFILYTHHVCTDVAGVFSSEYNTLVVTYFPSINLPFIRTMLTNVFTLRNIIISGTKYVIRIIHLH